MDTVNEAVEEAFYGHDRDRLPHNGERWGSWCGKCVTPNLIISDAPAGVAYTKSVWHGLYCRWFDARENGHTVRAAVWGWLADRVVRWVR